MDVRRHLDEQGFYEIETPFLPSPPGGARDYPCRRASTTELLRPAQSPQIFKQS
jgi:aspartyl-tRNA synthetase